MARPLEKELCCRFLAFFLLGLEIFGRRRLKHRKIGAARKRVLAGGDDTALDRGVGRDMLNDLLDLVDDLRRDDVHRPPGHIPGEQCDAIIVRLEAEIREIHRFLLQAMFPPSRGRWRRYEASLHYWPREQSDDASIRETDARRTALPNSSMRMPGLFLI